jgi:hypothetical protein
MGDTRTRDTSCIKSYALKFRAPRSLSPHLVNFRHRTLSCSSVALETVAPPPPPTVLDHGPKAHRRLVPGPGACLHLERAAIILFLKPSARCSWSLSRHHRPRPRLPRSAPPPSTSTLPPSGMPLLSSSSSPTHGVRRR